EVAGRGDVIGLDWLWHGVSQKMNLRQRSRPSVPDLGVTRGRRFGLIFGWPASGLDTAEERRLLDQRSKFNRGATALALMVLPRLPPLEDRLYRRSAGVIARALARSNLLVTGDCFAKKRLAVT
ncbi:MAG: hypothetical protein ACOYYJ_12720, partial [Chloroflexota bacterium]